MQVIHTLQITSYLFYSLLQQSIIYNYKSVIILRQEYRNHVFQLKLRKSKEAEMMGIISKTSKVLTTFDSDKIYYVKSQRSRILYIPLFM